MCFKFGSKVLWFFSFPNLVMLLNLVIKGLLFSLVFFFFFFTSICSFEKICPFFLFFSNLQ